MSNNLLIVESPSKAKTLKKYLGSDFEILASFGHVRDLVPKQGAVDTAHGFAMKYQLIARSHKYMDAIAKAVAKADKVFLATDPDREGEAIAWHITEILKSKKLLKNKPPQRVVFYEITESAVKAAIKEPREISMQLVNAQQARRALDYLVGFNLSPLLWRKIRPGLSAGRVQSPALRLIAEREQEIEVFRTQEYWTIHFDSHKDKQNFSSRLFQYHGEKLEQFSIVSESAHEKIIQELSVAKDAQVVKVDKKRKLRSPAPPFTTSTLQQEAVRKLNITTGRTMRIAQQLYEGVDIGGTSVGLITYMRTDSLTLANEAIAEIRNYVSKNFELDYLPKSAVLYKSKAKNVQEAHEAIRPTSIFRTPESVRHQLSAEQAKLYEMIWKRTLACQMSPAKFDVTSLDISVAKPDNLFRTSGQILVFPGFIAVYQEGFDEPKELGEERLPELNVGDVVPLDKLYGEQHFTQPPPRYTEASLVKTLEEHGIGRPSTYANIISTLLEREYVVLDKKHFVPTDVGRVVNKFLTEHFTRYVDYDFTAKLEDELDLVSTGKREWVPLLEDFWTGFNRLIEDKKNLSRKEVTQEQLDEACPKCGMQLTVRLGKRGKFVGCSGFPACDYTRNLNGGQETAEAVVTVEGRSCPKCGSGLVIKNGPYGKFIGCSSYPKCKFIESLIKPRDSGVVCPQCKAGNLIERKSRYGKVFYSCSTYPKCNYAVWNPPVAQSCPKCKWPILTLKTTKRRGTEHVCPVKECGYSAEAQS
jgi:DNA topoisomerase-1